MKYWNEKSQSYKDVLIYKEEIKINFCAVISYLLHDAD